MSGRCIHPSVPLVGAECLFDCPRKEVKVIGRDKCVTSIIGEKESEPEAPYDSETHTVASAGYGLSDIDETAQGYQMKMAKGQPQ